MITYNTCIRAPRYFIVPGMHVKVVNSYAAASLFVPVKDVSNVDFPTLGKPTNPMRVSPDFVTGHIVKQRGIKLVSYCIHLLVIDA